MNILLAINRDLLSSVDLVYKRGVVRFFIEDVYFIGVRTPVVRRIAGRRWLEIRDLDKKEVWRICEGLFEQGSFEEGTVAIAFVRRMERRWERADFVRFEGWLKKYIKNWAHDDDFCTHVLGAMIIRWPDLMPRLKRWTRSRNLWVRRAAAVSLIYPYTGPKVFLEEIFWVAEELMGDEEDLVQKGYGWMLKAAANHHKDDVFEFVMAHRGEMERVALRYAVEKMGVDKKKLAMG